MEQQINELKQLREDPAFWQEQKYYDDQARQEAAMDGRKPNQKTTDKINDNINKASAALSTFELWNYEVVVALEEIEAADAKAKTEQQIKSAWNS